MPSQYYNQHMRSAGKSNGTQWHRVLFEAIHHINRKVWDAVIGQILPCKIDSGNVSGP
jgi:hypothetical protein